MNVCQASLYSNVMYTCQVWPALMWRHTDCGGELSQGSRHDVLNWQATETHVVITLTLIRLHYTYPPTNIISYLTPQPCLSTRLLCKIKHLLRAKL